ncbi:class I SAM-dependent methyltransferase [Streptomyces sp. NPDC013433]|uniref:class I SAM-dependent methyltransferase n=1 Tax=Streptomyces sp. NPDC013433 TaxID=3155604 RepID=UPI003451C135
MTRPTTTARRMVLRWWSPRSTSARPTREARAISTFLTGDAAQLPFEDESFDAVYSIRAIRHTPDEARVHAELARVLKPGGVHLGNDWFRAEGLTAEWQEHCAEPVCQGAAPPSLSTPGRAGPSPPGGEPGACSTSAWSSPHAVFQGPRGRTASAATDAVPARTSG